MRDLAEKHKVVALEAVVKQLVGKMRDLLDL
jgi:hypothetical protein